MRRRAQDPGRAGVCDDPRLRLFARPLQQARSAKALRRKTDDRLYRVRRLQGLARRTRGVPEDRRGRHSGQLGRCVQRRAVEYSEAMSSGEICT